MSPDRNDESSATTLCWFSPPPRLCQTTVVPTRTMMLLGLKKLSPRSISTRSGFAAGAGLDCPILDADVAVGNDEVNGLDAGWGVFNRGAVG